MRSPTRRAGLAGAAAGRFQGVAEALGLRWGCRPRCITSKGHLLAAAVRPISNVSFCPRCWSPEGHTQLMRVSSVGDYALLGETVDDCSPVKRSTRPQS